MKITKIISVTTITFLLSFPAFSQELTQVIRGKIVDAESQAPLSFATIALITTKPPLGAISDEKGNFRLENVPVGRHNLQISYMGYETKIIPELMVTSGKELVLNIGLKENITQVEELVVKAYSKKDKPLNSMSTVSARTFSVEEAQRYAGGMDDPARLASAFAGVSTGELDDNGIIIRGNAPKGLLWRLEGIEIPNPNHFAGMTTFGGGGVSALSSLMLANSDFFTGAFPAEYGNALSGVFDIRLRTGNNQKHEHAFQLGALGLDISSEGPFSKNHTSSYLFNYRYSTFGLIKPVLPEEANVPIYQDLCFKVNLPAGKAGIFSVWGIGTLDKIAFKGETDTALWNYEEDQEIGDAKQRMAAMGFNHRYILGRKTYINSSLAVTGDYTEYNGGYLDFDLTRYPTEYIDNLNYSYTFPSILNHKFSARHTNRSGIIVTNLHYNTLLKFAPEFGDDLITAADETGSSNLLQFFSQSKLNFTETFNMNLGMHFQYFGLNEEFIAEPRLGITYALTNTQSLSLAYGKHSRLEPLGLYFARVTDNNKVTHPNKKLKLAKAHHMVLAYDISLTTNLRLKIEPYVQLLYDVPVIPDSSYSTINMEADWYFTDKLENTGTGTNMGIDITLERFLNDGYYYLITASLFDSKYTGGDKVERMTRYNTTYVINVLFGKEWTLGAMKNKILGINGRLNLLGGQRMAPLNEELTYAYQEVQYDYSRQFESRKPPVYHLNASVNYRINKRNHSSIWTLQVLNVLGTKEFYGYDYNYRKHTIDEDSVSIIVPTIAYKIEF
jgi:hypothetical protein